MAVSRHRDRGVEIAVLQVLGVRGERLGLRHSRRAQRERVALAVDCAIGRHGLEAKAVEQQQIAGKQIESGAGRHRRAARARARRRAASRRRRRDGG